MRRNASEEPPDQPDNFAGAWGSKRRREIQRVLCAGPVLEKWCSFEDYNAHMSSARRFFVGNGYQEQSVKVVVEVAALFLVDSSKRPGRRTKLSLFVSTAWMGDNRVLRMSPDRWVSPRPINYGVDIRLAVTDYYIRLISTKSVSDPDLASSIQSLSDTPVSNPVLDLVSDDNDSSDVASEAQLPS